MMNIKVFGQMPDFLKFIAVFQKKLINQFYIIKSVPKENNSLMEAGI